MIKLNIHLPFETAILVPEIYLNSSEIIIDTTTTLNLIDNGEILKTFKNFLSFPVVFVNIFSEN
jgi:hypothetical protein